MINKINVKISRHTEPTKSVEVNEGVTIDEILAEAGMSLSESENLYWNGNAVKGEDQPQDGDFIQIAGKKDGGLISAEEQENFFIVDEDGEVYHRATAGAAQAMVEDLVNQGTERDDVKVYRGNPATIKTVIE